MKQVIQNIGTGKLDVTAVPAPLAQRGQILITNSASLISAGTEKMVIELAQKSLIGKARERPDQVRRVLEKIRNEGTAAVGRRLKRKGREGTQRGEGTKPQINTDRLRWVTGSREGPSAATRHGRCAPLGSGPSCAPCELRSPVPPSGPSPAGPGVPETTTTRN
jgi:hypothetical protein